MNDDQILTIHAVPHRNPQVQRVGVPLDHPYVEQCWAPILGPSSVLVLRRVAVLWEHADPAEVPISELARSIGLGKGTGPNSPIRHTLDRLERHGFLRRGHDGLVTVATTVGPVSERQMDRLPEWSRQRHEVLWGRHLDSLATGEPPHPDLGQPPPRSADRPALSSRPTLAIPGL